MPVSGIFLVGVHRTSNQASRLQTMMAGRRDMLHYRQQAREPPTSRPTSRQVSFSSSPLSEWQAVTHALQPEQRSKSTSKAYCCPAWVARPAAAARYRSVRRRCCRIEVATAVNWSLNFSTAVSWLLLAQKLRQQRGTASDLTKSARICGSFDCWRRLGDKNPWCQSSDACISFAVGNRLAASPNSELTSWPLRD